MDHASLKSRALKTVFVFGLAAFFSACASKTKELGNADRTFFTSKLPPNNLLILAEQYLEWQKGFNVQIRDHQQGLLVTEWVHDENPSYRYRITLRVMPDPKGSLLSTHIETENLMLTGWKAVLANSADETHLVANIEKYVENSQDARRHTPLSPVKQN